MSQQQQPVQPQDDVNQPQLQAPVAQPQRQIVPPYNPQTRAEAAQPSTKTFMDYIKEHWWIVVLVFAALAGLIWWFCFRTPKAAADVSAASAALIGGAVATHTGTQPSTDTGSSKSGRSSGSSGSTSGSGSQPGSSSTIPKLNITSQRGN